MGSEMIEKMILYSELIVNAEDSDSFLLLRHNVRFDCIDSQRRWQFSAFLKVVVQVCKCLIIL